MEGIFALRSHESLFQYLDLEITDLLDLASDTLDLDDILEFSLRNASLKNAWVTPICEFKTQPANPKGDLPDISLWNDASLVLSPKAFRLLEDSLSSLGEFLSVLVGDETYYIFNCRNIGEVDQSTVKHEYSGEMKLGIKSFEFESSAYNQLLFKTPEELCRTLYCNQRFKSIIEELGLQGLSFDKNTVMESPLS